MSTSFDVEKARKLCWNDDEYEDYGDYSADLALYLGRACDEIVRLRQHFDTLQNLIVTNSTRYNNDLEQLRRLLAAQRERARLLEDALTALPDDYARASAALRTFDEQQAKEST